MPISSFVKTPYFLGFICVAGATGVGVGGWQVYEEIRPTAHKKLKREGMEGNPATPSQLQTGHLLSSNNTKMDSLDFRVGVCFEKMFPGVDVKMNEVSESDPELDADPLTKEAINENNYGPLKGCALMQMAYEHKEKFAVKSEVVARNDHYGGSLGSGLKYMKDKNNPRSFIHRLLFLKKENGEWKIKGGYYGVDASLTSNNLKNVYITISEESIKVDHTKESLSLNGGSYAGYGEENSSEEGATEVFQGIELYMSTKKEDRDGRMEILGRGSGGEHSNMFTGTGDQASFGFTYVSGGYSSSDGGRKFESSVPKNKVDTLNNGYAPFLGKKGKWKELNKKCSETSNKRHATDQELGFLKDFCYTQA